MNKPSTSEFIQMCQNASSSAEAMQIANLVYGMDASTSKNALSSAIKPSWTMFYELLKMENKFGIPHAGTALVAVDLCSVLVGKCFVSKKNGNSGDNRGGFDDFTSSLYIALRDGIIDKYDENINDNFLAFLYPEMRTVCNEVFKEELPNYLKQVKGLSVTSLDKLMSSEDSVFDPVDRTSDVEGTAIRREEQRKVAAIRLCDAELDAIEERIAKSSKKIIDKKEMSADEASEYRTRKVALAVKKASLSKAIIMSKICGGVKNFSNEMSEAFEAFSADYKG